MTNTYKNPPFEEAVCEINFLPNEKWDITYASDFYNSIKDIFKNKTTETVFDIMFNIVPQGINQLKNPEQKQILKCTNDNTIVRFSENILMLNVLKPYISWEIFKENTLFVLDKYLNICNPNGFNRITLKYINKIDAGQSHSYKNIKEIFTILPQLPENIEDANSTQMIVEIPYFDSRDILSILQATLLPESNKKAPILFEITYILAKSNAIEIKELSDWLENAHIKIKNIFEKGLTEQIKQKFC